MVALVPDDRGAWNNLGLALLGQGKHGEAEQAFRRQLEVRPGHCHAAANLESLLLGLGRPAEAVALLREVMEAGGRLLRRPVKLGAALVQIAPADQIRDALEASVEASPDVPLTRQLLACLLLYAGESGTALEHARRATRIDPDDAFGWVVLGRAEYLSLNEDRALFAYRRAREIDPAALEASPEDLTIWKELEGD